MAALVQGWGFTAIALVFISGVFVAGFFSLRRELSWVRTLTDFLGQELARDEPVGDAEAARTPRALLLQEIRDEAKAIRSARDAAWSNKQVRGWQMRTQRLEPALGFWIDFLRQLGLLFTVVGLGLSLAIEGSVEQLLAPLGLAVWTTVAGLAYSIWLSAQFGMTIPVWNDTCEKNIEAWDARRRAARPGDGEP
jgi:hypothetical protein